MRRLVALGALLVVAGCSHSVSGKAAWSPDVAKLKVTATTKVQLPEADHPMQLSPNGSRVAYTANSQICVADVDGSHQICPKNKELAADQGSFSWSPDGSKIALSDDFYRDMIEPDIWVMDAKTGDLKDITDDGVTKTSPGKVPANAHIDLFPNWSADSKTIRFTRQNGTDDHNVDLESIPAAGGAVTKIGGISSGSTPYDNSVVFSPDGETVAWSTGDEAPFQAHIQRVSGGSSKTLTAKKGADYNLLSFSADGKYLLMDSQIAYSSYTSTGGNPVVATVDSGDTSVVASDASSASYPTWLGGADSIAFVQLQLKNPTNSQLRVVAEPGGKSRTILTGQFGTASSRLSSAGSKLLLFKQQNPTVLTVGT
jgi:Tol biopolymer transport system component